MHKQTYLNFGIGIEPTLFQFDDKDNFRFTIVLIQDNEEHIVFEKYLCPGKNPGDTDWFHYELPILDVKEGSALLRFEYRTSLRSQFPIRGIWAQPFLTERITESVQEEALFTESEFIKMRKELIQKKLLLDRAQKDKKDLLAELDELKKEMEKVLRLAGKLQEELVQNEEEQKNMVKQLAQLHEIKKSFDKTLTGRLRKLFKRN
jgi:hypothetical protein